MKIRSFIRIVSLFSLFFFVSNVLLVNFANAESWNGIHPLQSTRAEVELILGKCIEGESKTVCRYRLSDKYVDVIYTSDDACSEKNQLWRVPQGTVTSISIDLMPGGLLRLKKSGYNLTEFRKEEDSELPGVVHYRSSKRGLTLTADRGLLTGLQYYPSDEVSKSFRCSSLPERMTNTGSLN